MRAICKAINKFFIQLSSDKIGQDQFGNEYYLSRKRNYLNQPKRLVIYHGEDEGSKVPAKWHSWLHYLTDAPIETKTHGWQQEHLPNLTLEQPEPVVNPLTDDQIIIKSYNSWRPH